MKKTVGALMVAVSAVTFASSANANNMEFKPYVGLDYTHTRANAKFARPYFNAGALNVGANYNKYFGTELFYQYSYEHRKLSAAGGRDKTKMQAYGLDLMGYLPLECHSRLSLIGTLGFGEYRLDQTNPLVAGTNRDHGWGYRIGVGAIYDITSNIAVRGIVRRIEFDKIAGLDHANEYSLGVRYTF